MTNIQQWISPTPATANETRSLHAHRKVSVRYFTSFLFSISCDAFELHISIKGLVDLKLEICDLRLETFGLDGVSASRRVARGLAVESPSPSKDFRFTPQMNLGPGTRV